MDSFYWPMIGLVTGGGLVLTFLVGLRRRQWTAPSLYVAVGAFGIGLLNMVAPFRGTFDPAYEGYRFGLLELDGGPAVGVTAGSLYLLSLLSIRRALANGTGRTMWPVVALTGSVLIMLGGYLLGGLLGLLPPFRVQLGEYLSIPPIPATLLAVATVLAPFLLGLPWALHRMSVAAPQHQLK